MIDNSILKQETYRITSIIVQCGGMATKSVLEDVLMNMFRGLSRDQAHSVMNEIECLNIPLGKLYDMTRGATLEEYAPYMLGVDIVWSKANPSPLDNRRAYLQRRK